jgi:hypothetical protein
MVRFPVGTGISYLLHSGPGAHPTSYSVGIGISFPGGKEAGT